MAAEKLRDLSSPIDVPLLDATVAAFYGTGSKQEVSYNSLPLSSTMSLTLQWITRILGFNSSNIHLVVQ